jgi:iron complex transport system ATP-binding protein
MVTIALDAVTARIGRRTILRDIGTTFVPGTLTAIIGPNGAGKSSLLRTILGLLPLEHGRIMLDDALLTAMSRAAIARTIAYLPQGQTLHWPLSIERLVSLGRLPHLAPLSRLQPTDASAVERAIERTAIAALRYRAATELSGGERARAMLARALAVEAPALLADEPLASLDPGHQLDVMALLRQEAARGCTVVAVLHDLTMAARFCDRLLLLDAGKLVAEGTPLDVLTPERLASVYGIGALFGTSHDAPVVVPLTRT